MRVDDDNERNSAQRSEPNAMNTEEHKTNTSATVRQKKSAVNGSEPSRISRGAVASVRLRAVLGKENETTKDRSGKEKIAQIGNSAILGIICDFPSTITARVCIRNKKDVVHTRTLATMST